MELETHTVDRETIRFFVEALPISKTPPRPGFQTRCPNSLIRPCPNKSSFPQDSRIHSVDKTRLMCIPSQMEHTFFRPNQYLKLAGTSPMWVQKQIDALDVSHTFAHEKCADPLITMQKRVHDVFRIKKTG